MISSLAKASILLALSLAATGCARKAGTPPADAPDSGRIDLLLAWMEGDFDNTPSLADPQRNAIEEHYPIVVHMRALPHLGDALYVEQASLARPDRPYRQRVYQLSQTADGRILVTISALNEPAAFRNAHLDPARLATITTDMLLPRTGCEVYLTFDGTRFVGGTEGTNCPSDLGESKYATSRVEVRSDGFTSLDQGWAADGSQAWGAEKLAYSFTRRPAGS